MSGLARTYMSLTWRAISGRPCNEEAAEERERRTAEAAVLAQMVHEVGPSAWSAL